jgi:hypothetical protein
MLTDYHPQPIQSLVLPLDLSYTLPVCLLLFSVNLPCRDSLTFHVPNILSIFHCLDHFKESIQFWGPVWHFITSCFLWWGVISPSYNHWAGEPPHVSHLWLLIQYICSYPPCLEAIFSVHNLQICHFMVTDPHNITFPELNFMSKQTSLLPQISMLI